jgi:hypothetical protein
MIDFYETTLVCYRCAASSWECIDDTGRGDLLECLFCGVLMRVDAAPRAAKPQPVDRGEFRFQFGRFKGMTLAEADAEPNGRRYLEVMMGRNEKLKPRIEEYLSHAAPSA